MSLWRLTAGRAHAFSHFVVVPAESFKLTRRLPRYHFTRSAAGFQHHVRSHLRLLEPDLLLRGIVHKASWRLKERWRWC
jgi:hypothetical protein